MLLPRRSAKMPLGMTSADTGGRQPKAGVLSQHFASRWNKKIGPGAQVASNRRCPERGAEAGDCEALQHESNSDACLQDKIKNIRASMDQVLRVSLSSA
jgi:hypothetical protein